MSDKKSVIIALGYFDSVHKGHVKVINKAVKKAKELDVSPAVFTFKGDLKTALGLGEQKCVFTYKERKGILNSLGVKEIFFAPIDKEFISKTKIEFLDFLNSVYDIKGYVSGEDYTFGSNRGSVKDLTEYAKAHNQVVITVKTAVKGGEKISTTGIKALLKEGRINRANALLSRNYFVTGKVKKGRKVGRDLGFPTANVSISSEKYPIKEGVYAGKIQIDGKEYLTAINYGCRPTYKLKEKLIEAHVLDFIGDLYGKSVKITFYKYIRGLKRFSNESALAKRIELDIIKVREYNYD